MDTKPPQTPDSSADSDSQWQTETEDQSETEPEWGDSWDSEAESEPVAEHSLRFPDFIQFYECLPASRFTQPGIEKGDKIVMPDSALVELLDLQVGHPMMFSLSNPNSTQETHCGVLEFSAPEGTAFLPQWMMKNLQLKEGEQVRVSSATLPKGTYIKLKPHTSDFLDITNPGAVAGPEAAQVVRLHRDPNFGRPPLLTRHHIREASNLRLAAALRRYTCLTVGDTLVLPYGNKEFRIDVVAARPENGVCIIDTDCEVDFAQAHDYEQPQKPATAASFSSTGPQEKGTKRLSLYLIISF